MYRLCILSSKATSLKNVSEDISFVASQKNYIPIVYTMLRSPFELYEAFDRIVFVMTFTPLYARAWFGCARDVWRRGRGRPTVFYTTIEGLPKPNLVLDWMRDFAPIVANSEYTRRMLLRAGIRVIDLVYHGIIPDYVETAKPLVKGIRRKLEERLGEGVYFGVVSTSHPRKGLDYLLQAVKLVRQQTKEAKFVVITDTDLSGVEGVYVEKSFGSHTREKILALMGAMDFMIVPSLCEGFGLIVIEANAMGRPVIHCQYPPLTEISGEYNLMYPFNDVKFVDVGDGILYEFHIYDPRELASTILDAVDMVKNRKSEYIDRCEKAVSVLDRFNAYKLYKRLLEILETVGSKSV